MHVLRRLRSGLRSSVGDHPSTSRPVDRRVEPDAPFRESSCHARDAHPWSAATPTSRSRDDGCVGGADGNANLRHPERADFERVRTARATAGLGHVGGIEMCFPPSWVRQYRRRAGRKVVRRAMSGVVAPLPPSDRNTSRRSTTDDERGRDDDRATRQGPSVP